MIRQGPAQPGPSGRVHRIGQPKLAVDERLDGDDSDCGHRRRVGEYCDPVPGSEERFNQETYAKGDLERGRAR